jgi:ammonium transporter Rh
MIAGCLSALGLIYLAPFMKKKLYLHDTCGVQFIHGIPGIIAWIVSVIVASSTNANTLKNTYEF